MGWGRCEHPDHPGTFFKGSLDELVFYRRALSDLELRQLAQPGVNGIQAAQFAFRPVNLDTALYNEQPPAGQIGYWPLDAAPDRVAAATLCLEDRRFADHPGVDPLALLRAVALEAGALDARRDLALFTLATPA